MELLLWLGPGVETDGAGRLLVLGIGAAAAAIGRGAGLLLVLGIGDAAAAIGRGALGACPV